MKIAYLVTDPGIPVFGNKGASIHVQCITSALASLGHDIQMLASNFNGENRRDEKISYHLVGDQEKARKRWKWVKKVIPEDEGEGSREKLKIAEMIKMDSLGRAAEEAIRIIKKNPVDLILERLSPFGGCGMIVSRKLGIPRIVEMNAPISEESMIWRQLQFNKISRFIENAALTSADGIVVVSDELKERLLKISIKKEKILRLPNGVDPDLFSPAPKDGELSHAVGIDGKFVIGFSGSLKKWHGVELLIQAFSKLREKDSNFVLLVVGDGPELVSLKRLSSELNILDQVIFTGKIPYDRMPAYTRLMDIATAPYSVNSEFYFSPLKILEYLACGIPVVASGGGEISRLIRNGETGVFIPQIEPDNLFQGIYKLYSNPSMRSLMSERGKKLIKGKSWKDNSRKILDFAENLLALRKR